jgi:DNA polymerase-3 subunit epsilon
MHAECQTRIRDPSNPSSLEVLATRLEESGLYRVLRRITPRAAIVPPPGTVTRQGILLDLEAAGLDPDQDEIIEMAMVPFIYGIDGTLYSVAEPFSRLRHPRDPISQDLAGCWRLPGSQPATSER